MRLLPTGRMQRGPVGLDELDRWVLFSAMRAGSRGQRQGRWSQPRSSQSEDGCLSCSSRGPMWTNAAAHREKHALRRGR